MKFAVLLVALICIFPLSTKLRKDARWYAGIWTLIGFSCFGINYSSLAAMSVYTWPAWNGHVKGIDITAIDLLVFAVFLALRGQERQSGVLQRYPLKVQSVLLLLALGFAVTNSLLPTASMFYLWQSVRMIFLSYVTWKACSRDEQVIKYILRGLGVGIGLEAMEVIWQKLGGGALQASGSFGHQNLLGMVTHFVLFPFAAAVLARKSKFWEKAVVAATIVIVVFTASRATIGLAGVGLVALFVLSIALNPSPQKFKAFVAFLLMGVVAVPLALNSLGSRFKEAPLGEEYDERAAFVRAATAMWHQYPLGIGPNTFVLVANSGGFYQDAGVAATYTSRSGHVHNFYWLLLVELNAVGLAIFIWGLLKITVTCLRGAMRDPKGERGAILLGIFMAFAVAAVHSWFEWIFILGSAQYFATLCGAMGLALASKVGQVSAQPKRTAGIAMMAPAVGRRPHDIKRR